MHPAERRAVARTGGGDRSAGGTLNRMHSKESIAPGIWTVGVEPALRHECLWDDRHLILVWHTRGPTVAQRLDRSAGLLPESLDQSLI